MNNKERASVIAKWLALYKSAEKRGLEFDLSISEVRKLFNRKTCMATGIKFYSGAPVDTTKKDLPWNYKTFERIDESKGYVTGNVIVAIHSYNNVKAQLFSDGRFSYLDRDIIFKILEGMVKWNNKLKD